MSDKIERISRAGRIDIGAVIDDGRWTGPQRAAVLVAALAIVLDGFDSQLIGFAIPVLIKEWGVSKAAFAPVVAMGLIGMAVGSAAAGYVADRFGRRIAIFLSVLAFGGATIAIGLAPDIPTIALLRFVAGLGIGGGFPTAATMTAELTPLRYRTMAVTGTIVCVPLGGMLAGLFSGQILPAHGWRALFYAGGALPLAFSLVLLLRLPESPRWLARQAGRSQATVALLGRLGIAVPEDARFFDSAERPVAAGNRFSAIFADGRASSTIALWAAFFLTILSVYLAFNWLPTMLTSAGLSVAAAGRGLTAYNLGGVIGALAFAVAINRFGSRWPLVLACLGAAGTAYGLRQAGVAQESLPLTIGIGLHGLFVNAVQSTMYALAAHIYPTHIRATGTATALSVGRLGAIFSAFAGAAVISNGGAAGYLDTLTLAMLGAGVALLLLRAHIKAARHGALPPAPVD